MSPIAPLFQMTGNVDVDMMNLMTGFTMSSPTVGNFDLNEKKAMHKSVYYIYGVAKIVYECLSADGQVMSNEPSQLSFHIKKVEQLLGDTNRDCFSKDSTIVQNLRLSLLATVNQKLDEMSKKAYTEYAPPTSPAFKLPGLPASKYPRLPFFTKSVTVSLEVFDFILQATRAILFTPDIVSLYGELSDDKRYGCYSTYSSLASEYKAQHIRTSSDAEHTLTSSFAALSSPIERERFQFRTGANRDVAYAKLCGYTVGEYRGNDCGTHKKDEYVVHGFCVCQPGCKCTKNCNKQPVRACPCQLRIDTIKLKRLDRKINAIDMDERNLPLTVFRGKASEGAKSAIKYIVNAAKTKEVKSKEMMEEFRGLLRGFHKKAEVKWPMNSFQLKEGPVIAKRPGLGLGEIGEIGGKRGAASPLKEMFAKKRNTYTGNEYCFQWLAELDLDG